METNQIREKIKEYPYAIIHLFSELKFCKTEFIGDIIWEECMEARFFGNGKEYRIWRDGDVLREYEFQSENEFIEIDYELDQRFRDMAKYITVRKYVGYDEDGQAFIENTMPAGLRG